MKLLFKIFRFIIMSFNNVQNFILLKGKRVEYHTFPNIRGVLKIWGNGKVILGKNVSFNSGKSFNPIGGDKKMVLKTVRNSVIEIGANSGISNSSIICYSSIKIGNHVKIGGSVKIYDTDFHNLDYIKRSKKESDIPINNRVIIKDYAFVGAHSIILKGAVIGEKSIVGAGSVVTKSIPDGEIWGGNPAKFIRKI